MACKRSAVRARLAPPGKTPGSKIQNGPMTPGTDTSSWCFRYLVAAENVSDPAQCFPLRLAVLMGVDLQRDGHPGMAEDQLGVAGRDLQVLQQRRGSVPQMMHRDDPQTVRVADPAEGPGEVARLDWSSCFGTEDEASVLPGRAHLQAVSGLDGPAGLQDLGGRGEQRQVAAQCRVVKGLVRLSRMPGLAVC